MPDLRSRKGYVCPGRGLRKYDVTVQRAELLQYDERAGTGSFPYRKTEASGSCPFCVALVWLFIFRYTSDINDIGGSGVLFSK